MKFAVSKDLGKEGMVYLLEIDVDGKMVQKIGITTRKIEDRVVEITASYFKGRRYFPFVRPKRFRKANDILDKEQSILEWCKEYKFTPEKRFQGSSELLDMNLDVLVTLYEQVIEGRELINVQWEACEECGKDKKFVKFNEDGSETLVCGKDCCAEESNEE